MKSILFPPLPSKIKSENDIFILTGKRNCSDILLFISLMTKIIMGESTPCTFFKPSEKMKHNKLKHSSNIKYAESIKNELLYFKSICPTSSAIKAFIT